MSPLIPSLQRLHRLQPSKEETHVGSLNSRPSLGCCARAWAAGPLPGLPRGLQGGPSATATQDPAQVTVTAHEADGPADSGPGNDSGC